MGALALSITPPGLDADSSQAYLPSSGTYYTHGFRGPILLKGGANHSVTWPRFSSSSGAMFATTPASYLY
jgi:hypothetical protein